MYAVGESIGFTVCKWCTGHQPRGRVIYISDYVKNGIQILTFGIGILDVCDTGFKATVTELLERNAVLLP